jgi:dihydroorotate dehydrogenase
MAVWYSLANFYLSRVDPERAHAFALKALAKGWVAGDRKPDPTSLETKIWGKTLSNPIGLAAGFDKNAEALKALPRLGFGLLEFGTVTPRPQPGNDQPRLFRLAADRGVINRMGFPGHGLRAVQPRLVGRSREICFGINIGANKDSPDRVQDYIQCAAVMVPYADYLVCNVSSPNTPGLRDLQSREALADLLKRVRDVMGVVNAPPLLVKISPDVTDGDLDDIVTVCRDVRVGGIIVGNTTVSRPPSLRSARRGEAGGLSGAPLMTLSTEVLLRTARRVEGQFPLIGCGGVASGADAYAKIRAGASLVQLYTALVFEGPAVVRRIKDQLAALLVRDGFASVMDAVGADLR